MENLRPLRQPIGSYVLLTLLFCNFFMAVETSQAAPVCKILFQAGKPSLIAEPTTNNLYDHYENEIQGLTNREVQNLNKQFVDEMQAYVPPVSERAQSLNWGVAKQMINVIRNHAVASFDHIWRYQQTFEPGLEAGFCFGRATYLHLLALKLGLQKQSMKKIWAIGPMSADGIVWGYHVALLAYSKNLGWIVLEATEKEPMALTTWMNLYLRESVDQRLRFYVTPGEKMGVTTGKYSRGMMGLDVSYDNDWFKYYFVELMRAFRQETIQSLGLWPLNPATSQVKPGKEPKKSAAPPGFFQELMDIVTE